MNKYTSRIMKYNQLNILSLKYLKYKIFKLVK